PAAPGRRRAGRAGGARRDVGAEGLPAQLVGARPLLRGDHGAAVRFPVHRADVVRSARRARSGAAGAVLQNGKLVRWAPGVLLTYCVLRSTFRSEREYATARANMLAATRDWEETCGVSFRHVVELDERASRPAEVVFPVQRYDAGGRFIAAAFFPHE